MLVENDNTNGDNNGAGCGDGGGSIRDYDDKASQSDDNHDGGSGVVTSK